jgi:DNA-binding IclR family transcriptional regulator
MSNNLTSSDEKNYELIRDSVGANLINPFLDVKSLIILHVISDLPKSVSQISRETKIPINTVYNKMRKLTGQKIIKISGSINDLGRKQLQYQSKLNPSVAFFEQ